MLLEGLCLFHDFLSGVIRGKVLDYMYEYK